MQGTSFDWFTAKREDKTRAHTQKNPQSDRGNRRPEHSYCELRVIKWWGK